VSPDDGVPLADPERELDARALFPLGDILFGRNGAPSLAELRGRYLSPEEREAVERRGRGALIPPVPRHTAAVPR
jgi:hypothetical protein